MSLRVSTLVKPAPIGVGERVVPDSPVAGGTRDG